MATEIERKFLVRETGFLDGRKGERIVQGYVAKESGALSTRVRLRADRAFLTLKGPRDGLSRDEFEYAIPVADAQRMLTLYCGNRIIQKTRYVVDFEHQAFEVDVFEGRHAGLVIAEIELQHEKTPVVLPPWIGHEVTHDRRYGNFVLAQFEGPMRPIELKNLAAHGGHHFGASNLVATH
ncbi:MAG: CYTH domain-containing protein [Betaproteobacteria bacterium]|nr:MAG: CYTH domain-containing protein [Betaproteobacteria bacterium]